MQFIKKCIGETTFRFTYLEFRQHFHKCCVIEWLKSSGLRLSVVTTKFSCLCWKLDSREEEEKHCYFSMWENCYLLSKEGPGLAWKLSKILNHVLYLFHMYVIPCLQFCVVLLLGKTYRRCIFRTGFDLQNFQTKWIGFSFFTYKLWLFSFFPPIFYSM